MTYTPETLRAHAKEIREYGADEDADKMDAHADAWEKEHRDTNELISAAFTEGYHDGLEVNRKRLEAAEKALRRAVEIHETIDYLPDRIVNAWARQAHAALAAGDSE